MRRWMVLGIAICLAVWTHIGALAQEKEGGMCECAGETWQEGMCDCFGRTQQGAVSAWGSSHRAKLSESSGETTCYITYTAEEVYSYCPQCGKQYVDTHYHETHSVCPIHY